MANPQPLLAPSDASFQDAIRRMLDRIEGTAASVGEAFPLSADPATGAWQTAPDGRWTGGFWTGLLWLAHAGTGERRYRDLARAALARLKVRLAVDNVLNGLVFHYGAACGAWLSSDAEARDVALRAADALAARFNPGAGFIPLGHQSGSLTGDPQGETNIDGVPGMSLLFWAAANGGAASLKDIAAAHVRRHIELCARADGSLHQAALVDPATGATLKQYSPRGLSAQSAWARAQSWGLLGFAQAYAWTSERFFYDAARRVADWWLANAPGDRVAFWDFRDPSIPATFRDTSATAMVAAALLKLARLAPDAAERRRYEGEGRAIVRALVEGYLTPTSGSDRRPGGILVDGCWQRNEGMATRSELIWGDYFLFEALLCASGKLEAVL